MKSEKKAIEMKSLKQYKNDETNPSGEPLKFVIKYVEKVPKYVWVMIDDNNNTHYFISKHRAKQYVRYVNKIFKGHIE